MPLVSVVIPTHNRADLLSEAIQSVLDQTYRDFELIVVDDGSSDHTADVVAGFQDPRIIYHRQEKQERGAARNNGVAISRGEYITFLDDDDWYMPGKLDLQVTALHSRPEIGMVIGGWDRVEASGEIVREERPWLHHPNPVLRDWLFAAMAHVAAVLIRRSWFEKVGGFNIDLAPNEDTYLWFRLAEAGCPVAWVKAMVFRQRMHTDNSVRNLDEVKKGKLAMLGVIFADGKAPAALGIREEDAYARVYMGFACLGYGSDQVEAASTDLVHAVELDASLLLNDADLLLQIIASYAWNHLTPNPLTFTNRVFSNLPAELSGLRRLRRKAVARTWVVGALRAYQYHDLIGTRTNAIKALAAAPSLLRNRGLVSILAQSLLHTGRWKKRRGGDGTGRRLR